MSLYLVVLTVVYILSGMLASNDITSNVFGHGDASVDVFPVAFTDYDGDKRTDLIVLTKNFSSFRIYFGSPNTPSLQYAPEFHCDIFFRQDNLLIPVKIIGLNVADFTGDGVNDIMVAFQNHEDKGHVNVNGTNVTKTFVSVFKGGLNSLKCEALVINGNASLLNNTRLVLRREPLIVDVNGDMIADLVGETMDNQRKIWTFRRDLPPNESLFPCNGECLPIETGGFVDVDGDFIPDLVLVTHVKNEKVNDTTERYSIEIYNTRLEMSNHGLFQFRKNISIGFTIGRMGSALFLDMIQTGLDHLILIPFCSDKKCKNSGFALVDVILEEVHQLNVPFTDNEGIHWSFMPPSLLSTHPEYLNTINVRAGDYNLDGYPDLIATLSISRTSSSQAESRSVFFKNIPCQGPSCSYPRTFEPNFSLFESYHNVMSTAFYDSNENGLLDVMGLRQTSKHPNETFAIFVQENSPEYDAYFIRWIIISGLCEKNCPAYGVMLPGGTMKYTTTNDNNPQSSRASQVFRHGFGLDLPGNLMGTGASANFIDTLTFGGTLNGGNYSRTQIIPNSNLITIPWRQRGGTKYKWEMKQILRPKDGGIMATFHVLLLICFLNASLVVFLHMRERKIDRIERSRDPVSMSALTMT